MRIEAVVISCYPGDLYLTRLCVASIRFWYPRISIFLLKDCRNGDFSTREIERFWNVQVYPTQERHLGWGFGKLDVLTESPPRRLLLLDSDTAFVGRVIGRLERFSHDLTVDHEDYPAVKIESQFFNPDVLHRFDPTFKFPGYCFNTGQVVVTTGRLTKRDFNGLVNWQTRGVIHPDIFKMGEQGIFNYVALRKCQFQQLSIRREPFMVWPGEAPRAEHIQALDLTADSPHHQIIHWAGLGWGKPIEQMPRSDLLMHFENLYYGRVKFGKWVREYRRLTAMIKRVLVRPIKEAAKRSF